MTAAQLSARALGQRVEDYASVQLRTARGVLGTIELGNTVPRAGSDSEFKIAGRDAILIAYHDDRLRLITAAGEEIVPAPPAEPLYPAAVRAIVECCRRGAPPPVSVHDLLPVVRLIDQAYERRKAAGKMRNLDDIIHAHMEGTVMRVRPKLMTVGTMLVGLVPLLWATGSGADATSG